MPIPAFVGPMLASMAPSFLGAILAMSNKDPRYEAQREAAQLWSPENWTKRFGENLTMFQNSPMFKQNMLQAAARANRGNQDLYKSLGPRAGSKNLGVSYNVNTTPAMTEAWRNAQQATQAQLGGQAGGYMNMGGLPTNRQDALWGSTIAGLGGSLPYILENWNKWFPNTRLPYRDMEFWGSQPIGVPPMRPRG